MPGKSKILTTSAVAAIIAVAPVLEGAPAQGVVAAPAKSKVSSMRLAQLRRLAPPIPAGLNRYRVDRVPGYQGQRRCLRGNRPGTLAMARLIRRTYSSSMPIGLSRGCGGSGSEHYDGRALDWMVNSRNARGAAMGDAFTTWLTARRQGVPGVMARRLGVMYIIWRGRMWRSYRPGWTDYQGCSRGRGGDPTTCHRDHVHISLTWAGARKQTSWYRVR